MFYDHSFFVYNSTSIFDTVEDIWITKIIFSIANIIWSFPKRTFPKDY